MCPVPLATPNWFDSHEYIALWPEVIALVAIFFWDRWDSHQQHQETLKQMKIAKASADAAIAAERAWVMVDIEKGPGAGFIVDHSNTATGTYGTSAHIRCICSNQGKTPAHILEIRACLLPGINPLPHEPDIDIKTFDTESRYLQSGGVYKKDGGVHGEGGRGIANMVVIYGIVRYRHLFSNKEVHTTFGYRLTPSDELRRLEDEQYRKYNENT